MAASQPKSSTFGTQAPAPSSESSSTDLSATSLSRSSSSSSDLPSVSSSTSVGLAVDGSADDQLDTNRHHNRVPTPINHSSYKMSRRSSNSHDELDLASRRASGRNRKLTEKYQALTGSKLLPVDSANIASEDTASPSKSDSPDDSLRMTKPTRRSSSTKDQSASPTVALPTSAKTQSPKVDKIVEAPLVATEIDEEPTKRNLRRERKPSTRYLESIAAPADSDDVNEQGTRASPRRRRSSAKVVELESAPSSLDRLVTSKKDAPRLRVPTPPKHLGPQAEDTHQSDTARKRSASPIRETPQAKTLKLSSRPSEKEAEPTASIPPKPSKPPIQAVARPKPPRLSLKAPRQPSSLRFALSSAEDDNEIMADDRLDTKKKASAERAAKVKSSSPRLNGIDPKPQKVVTLKYGVAPARLSKMQDATPIRFSPIVVDQNQTAPKESKCNLFCLSPSSRILAFAQLAAESTDSDDEDEDDDSDDIDVAKPSSRGLYEKWMAIGRERFCVCNKPATTHAHPATANAPNTQPPQAQIPNGVSTSTPKDPILSDLREGVEMPLTIPEINSIMPASEGRRVSALYSAITDSGAEARPSRSSTRGTSMRRMSEPVKSRSFEERMSEDYKALQAIRQQAIMEGVRMHEGMGYDEVKALLDEHRLEASSAVGHGHGLIKIKSRPIRL